jgi:hypothetical protein
MNHSRRRGRVFGALVACASASSASLVCSTTSFACSTVYTINLQVELSPEIAKQGEDILVELRSGAVGRSKVVSNRKFHGKNGTVSFSGLCAGAYFVDIGNGDLVAVGPVHNFNDGAHYISTIRVSFSEGNVSSRRRSDI